jgi:FMN-dependent NADH-azoreductase
MEIPYITEEVIGYNYGFVKLEDLSPKGKSIVEIQSKFIEQIKRVDEIVVSVPLWNFGMPAILKAYIDLIVKV